MVKHILSLIFLIGVMITHGSALRCYMCEATESGNCFNNNDGDLKEYESNCSDLTTEAPTTVTEAPTTVTEAPTTVTEAPTTVTEAPTTVTEAPTTVTEAPTTVTEAPTTVTEAPTTVTEAPTIITEAPTVPEVPSVVQVRQRRYIREEATQEYKCYVAFAEIEGKRRVDRGCVKAELADNHCDGVDDCRTCSGDLCNAAGSIKGSTTGIFAVLTAVYLLFSK